MTDENTTDTAAEAYAKLKALREAAKAAQTVVQAPPSETTQQDPPPPEDPLVKIADAPTAVTSVVIEAVDPSLLQRVEEKVEEVVEFISDATKAEMECGKRRLEELAKLARAELGLN